MSHYKPHAPPFKHTTSSGQTYAYHYHPPTSQTKPTLLFLHGFPATSHEWYHQTTHFASAGYGILAPDLIGYGYTSKPLALAPYIGKSMASDIISLLHYLSLSSSPVIGIAHDWGTYLLSQLAIWYPSYFAKLVFMSVPFSPPGRELDVHRINEATKRKTGFEQFGYQVFLAGENAGRVIGENWETFFNLAYPSDPKIWSSKFAPLGSMESAIRSPASSIPVAPYISPAMKTYHHEVFGTDYEAPCKWYVRGIRNLGVEEERRALGEGEIVGRLCEDVGEGKKRGFQGSVLMVTGLRDPVCPAGHARGSMNSTVAGGEKGRKLTVVDVDAGHWIMLEKVAETNRILGEFFEMKEVGEMVRANL